jgi:mono/diheme cytochrome c family protein
MRRLLLLCGAGVWLLVLVAIAAGWGPFAGSTDAGTVNTSHAVPSWIVREKLPQAAIPGAKLFSAAGCASCHTYAGSGRQLLGAPDLTAIGRRRLGVRFQIRHLECPSCVHPGSRMESYAPLGPDRLRELAVFLEASKGTR